MGVDERLAPDEPGRREYGIHEGPDLEHPRLARARVSRQVLRPAVEAQAHGEDQARVGEGGDVQVGKPYVEGSRVQATVEGHGRGKKVRIVKFRRRKHYMKRQGHRQWYTELKITGISAG